jgi:hypothetical protein
MGTIMAFFSQRLNRLRQRLSGLLLAGLAAILSLSSGGCAAISNPVGDGIPARRVPNEYLGSPKDDLRTIPLIYLLNPPTFDSYRLGAGDTLGIFIDGVLGEKEQVPAIRFPEDPEFPPAVGIPILVREDGTILLPGIDPKDPLKVKDKTLQEVEELLRDKFLNELKIIAKDARVLVSLMAPRRITVQVVRQETQQIVTFGGVSTSIKRSPGFPVSLPAYKNDVLNALNRTGGLPSFDSLNEVTIQRRTQNGDVKEIRIPMRLPKGEDIPFQTDDIKLQNSDVIFIEGRETEVYYIGGLTQPRQLPLPRDYDLRVREAIGIGGAPIINGGVNQNNLSGNIIASGLGSPSPSQVTVVRRTKDGGQVKIIVNLNRAFNNPRENIIVQPGDFLILQETVGEAMTRYFTGVIRFNFAGLITRQRDLSATVSGTGP